MKEASKSVTGQTYTNYPLPAFPRSIWVAYLKKSLAAAPAFTTIE
jgi:hypothetical protein